MQVDVIRVHTHKLKLYTILLFILFYFVCLRFSNTFYYVCVPLMSLCHEHCSRKENQKWQHIDRALCRFTFNCRNNLACRMHSIKKRITIIDVYFLSYCFAAIFFFALHCFHHQFGYQLHDAFTHKYTCTCITHHITSASIAMRSRHCNRQLFC